MKLRNKKTGEIIETDYKLSVSVPDNDNFYGCKTYNEVKGYNSLSELNEEWEDYQEPKEYWYINSDSVIYATDYGKYPDSDLLRKEIGNYFESTEEAEDAVEKLKAWKRLRDKGFRFDGYDVAHNSHNIICGQAYFKAGDYYVKDVEKDLDSLFGGEE